MKTRFHINNEIWCREETDYKDHFDRYYKDKGTLLDEENEECYFEVDQEIRLVKGDSVYLCGFRTVEGVIYDIDNMVILINLVS